MKAWDALKAASSLSTGNAWALLTHPKEGGGLVGTIISDGYFVELPSTAITAEIVEMNVEIQLDTQAVAVELQTDTVVVELQQNIIEVEID